MTTQIDYKGVRILVDSSGKFKAQYNNEDIEAETLAACKAKIEKLIKRQFKPVQVLLRDGSYYRDEPNDTFNVVTITAIARGKGYFKNKYGNSTNESCYRFYKNLPEKIKQLQSLVREIHKLEQEKENLQRELQYTEASLRKEAGLEESE